VDAEKRRVSASATSSRALKAEQSLVSHHLQLLRKCGLVKCKREGRKIRYRLASKQIAELLEKIDELSQKLDQHP